MSIKKTLSFILIFSIILSLFATAIYAIEDVETAEEIEVVEEIAIEDAPYYREVAVLSALGIMEGKSETDFGADDFLTRAEMSTIAVRFLGLETENQGSAESNYSDVDSTHWGKYYIDTATALDVVSGNGDGTFSPDEETTAEQALKMLVCSLGYEPKAEELGGYPKGYLTTANQLGLLKGVDFSDGYDKPVERWKIAMMVYNALEVDLMEIKAYGDEKESAIAKDITALKKYHKTERGNGYIKGTYSATLDNEYLDKGEVKIDDTNISQTLIWASLWVITLIFTARRKMTARELR